jgi:hypothetical protein
LFPFFYCFSCLANFFLVSQPFALLPFPFSFSFFYYSLCFFFLQASLFSALSSFQLVPNLWKWIALWWNKNWKWW